MSGGRIILLLMLAAGALAISALFAARLPEALSVPEGRPGSTAVPFPRRTVRPGGDNWRTRRDSRAVGRPRRPLGADAPTRRPAADPSGPRVLGLALPVLIALELGAGVLGLGALGAALIVGRTRRRRCRSCTSPRTTRPRRRTSRT